MKKAGIGYNNIRTGIDKGGAMKSQRELAALVPYPEKIIYQSEFITYTFTAPSLVRPLYDCLEYKPDTYQTLALSVHCT